MDIQESSRRILEREAHVADLFYLVFLERHPEVQAHFADVDMKRQAVLLTVALQLVVQYYVHSFPAVEAYLQILGREHCRRGIASELYPKWREALLATLSRFHGTDWDEQLSGQWRNALELASRKMLDSYEPEPREGRPST